jgi:hypothetical protein
VSVRRRAVVVAWSWGLLEVMEARESIPPRELYRWQSLDGNDGTPDD